MNVLRQIRADKVVTGVAVWAVCGSASTMNLRENPGGEYDITQEGVGVGGHTDCGTRLKFFLLLCCLNNFHRCKLMSLESIREKLQEENTCHKALPTHLKISMTHMYKYTQIHTYIQHTSTEIHILNIHDSHVYIYTNTDIQHTYRAAYIYTYIQIHTYTTHTLTEIHI